MVPKQVAKQLLSGARVAPEKHQFVVVFFSDIKGFSSFADDREPMNVFFSLDRVISIMDCCVSQFPELYKVESSGDAYNVVGIVDDFDNPASQGKVVHAMMNFALLVRKAVQLVPLDETQFVEIRIGLHCGDAVGGICGRMTPRYHFYGETISIAKRIETAGLTNRIHVSSELVSVVKHLPGSDAYLLDKREEPVNIKGSMLQTYWLENSPNIDIDTIYYETFKYLQKMVEDFTAGEPELLAIISESVDASVDAITPRAYPSFPLISSSSLSSESISSLPLVPLQPSTIANFTDMSTFEFNVFSVPDDYVSISNHMFGIFDNLFDLDSLNVEKKVLLSFIRRISRSYRTVPYHNFFHAFCVVQFTGALLVQWNLRQELPAKEIFCLLVCALIHDVDHPGTNNSFEVATKSRLSILYNDISVLENHHIALGSITTTNLTPIFMYPNSHHITNRLLHNAVFE